MELLRLRYFAALAETENLTQTANDLHISPSSLSLTIAKLEKELGTELFDRSGRKLALNETGKEFLYHIQNSLTELDLAISKAKHKDTVSIIMGLPSAWSAPLSEFLKLKPGIHVSNRTVRRSSLERELAEGDYDFWLNRSETEQYSALLHTQRLSSPSLFLAVPETSELARKSSVTFDDIKDENFIFPFSTYSLYDTYIQLCQEKNFEPKIVSNCSFFVRMKMVSTGLGVTFVDGDTTDFDLFKHVVFLPISDAPALPARYICWRKDKKLTPAAQEFLKFITVYYQDA